MRCLAGPASLRARHMLRPRERRVTRTHHGARHDDDATPALAFATSRLIRNHVAIRLQSRRVHRLRTFGAGLRQLVVRRSARHAEPRAARRASLGGRGDTRAACVAASAPARDRRRRRRRRTMYPAVLAPVPARPHPLQDGAWLCELARATGACREREVARGQGFCSRCARLPRARLLSRARDVHAHAPNIPSRLLCCS